MACLRLVYFGRGGYSFVPATRLHQIPGDFALGEPYKTNAQLVNETDGSITWVNLSPEQVKAAVAAETPQRRGHPAECQCGPCKRENRENRSFLRAYVGA